jgi:hypothetical protein
MRAIIEGLVLMVLLTGMTRAQQQPAPSADQQRAAPPPGYVEATPDNVWADPRFQSLSAEAKEIVLRRIDPVMFMHVYGSTAVDKMSCRRKLRTAEQVSDQLLQSLAPLDFNDVTDQIGLCMARVGMFRPSELHRAALVLSKFVERMRESAQASCQEDEERQCAVAEGKQRAATEQLISKYNDLVDRFNTLQKSYNDLWENYSSFRTAAIGAEARMQNDLSSCASSFALQQAIEDYQRMEQMRQPLPPLAQPTVCHTEYDGAYGLNTVCQ